MDPELEAQQEAAMESLAPLLVHFHEGWHGAQSKYRSYDPSHTVEHDDSTAASCLRCHMWAFVQNQIVGLDGVTPLTVRGLKLINYFDKYVLRFKKVDKAGLHANYPTAQQDDFDRGESFPDFPDKAIRLTCGYQLDAAADAIERVLIARISGKSVLWLSQINVIAAEAAWENVTPARFVGMGRVDARFRRRGGA
nr:hypothetical protein NG677_09160 [Methylobacterium sp. OTU13CASTA1]